MDCCGRIQAQFDHKLVAQNAERYRKKGAPPSTTLLVDALKSQSVDGLTLLDIGGGIGAVQHSLLQAGASTAISVEASTAFLEAAKEEAMRRGIFSRIHYYEGDFVALATEIPSADIVTLDRMICCYDNMETLVTSSAEKSRHLYGVVFPKDAWWMKISVGLHNLFGRIMGNPFRLYVHESDRVHSLLEKSGFSRKFYKMTLMWQVSVYHRKQSQK